MDNALAQINHLAVVAAAVSAFLLGGLWYSLLFGKAWMSATGITEERAAQANQAKVFAIAFVWSLLGAYLFAMFLGPEPAIGFAAGVGFLAGLFWVAGSFAISYQFEQRPARLLFINGGYHTLQYTLYGTILGLWH
jgi:hypothetical protein